MKKSAKRITKKIVKRKNVKRNPETAFGYIPQIGNLSFKELESLISEIDFIIHLYKEGKSKLADARLHKLEKYYGRSAVEKAYYYRKYD